MLAERSLVSRVAEEGDAQDFNSGRNRQKQLQKSVD
jgi:hypothetical protein